MKKSIAVLFQFLFCTLGYADQPAATNGRFSISASALGGFIIAHRPALVPLQEGHVKGFDVSIAVKRDGDKQWERDFLFPETGINISCFDLGTDRLGTGIALYPYLDFPLSKTGSVHLRYGMGIGYIEKIFDRDVNYKNAAIGSHWNGVIHLDLHYEKAVKNDLVFLFATGLTHFSNGAFQMPNLGINIPHLNLGIKKSFGTMTPVAPSTTEKAERKPYTAIMLSGGAKKVYPPYGKQYYVGNLTAARSWPLAKKSFAGLGADLFFDNSISGRLRDLKNEPTVAADDYRAGLYGTYELRVGALGLMFNMGYYLVNQYKDDGNAYHRIGLRYFYKKLLIGVNLKTHYARADHFDFGCGFQF